MFSFSIKSADFQGLSTKKPPGNSCPSEKAVLNQQNGYLSQNETRQSRCKRRPQAVMRCSGQRTSCIRWLFCFGLSAGRIAYRFCNGFPCGGMRLLAIGCVSEPFPVKIIHIGRACFSAQNPAFLPHNHVHRLKDERNGRRGLFSKKSVKSGDMRGGFDTLQFPPPENACVLGGD